MSFNPGGGGSSTLSGDSDVALSNVANNQVLTYKSGIGKWQNATLSGVAGAPLVPAAFVYQSGGQTIAVKQDGTTISSLATTAANNVTVINAAITAIAGNGTQTNGGDGGGGGGVQLSAQQYQVNASIVMQYGVSLFGTMTAFDRGGPVYNAAKATTNGTTLKAVADSIDIIQFGAQTTGSGVHLATNPHGAYVSQMQIDGHGQNSITGIHILDTTDPHVFQVTVSDCLIGINVDSTQAPNSGGTVACKIIQTDLVGCDTGININGSQGGTDGEITSCRLLNSQVVAINMQKGGWQITQCHFTAGHQHISATAAGTMISNNYFDTSGSDPQITTATGCVSIVGNYFIPATATVSIQMTGNGYRSVVANNTLNACSTQLGFVQLPGNSPSTTPVIVMGNTINTLGTTGFVAPVINLNGTAVADQDTANGAYVKGNRTWSGS